MKMLCTRCWCGNAHGETCTHPLALPCLAAAGRESHRLTPTSAALATTRLEHHWWRLLVCLWWWVVNINTMPVSGLWCAVQLTGTSVLHYLAEFCNGAGLCSAQRRKQ